MSDVSAPVKALDILRDEVLMFFIAFWGLVL